MTELTTLDERLAEIDERLRSLQSELDGGGTEPGPAEPGPARPASGPSDRTLAAESPVRVPTPTPLRSVAPPAGVPAVPADDVLARLHELSDAHERLLDLHRELLSQYAELLARRAGEAAAVSLVAGPFADAAALRTFQRELGALPGVIEVTTREFPGGDRVALDVRLAGR